MIVGVRPERTTWTSLDAATIHILGCTEFDSKETDTPATDGYSLSHRRFLAHNGNRMFLTLPYRLLTNGPNSCTYNCGKPTCCFCFFLLFGL